MKHFIPILLLLQVLAFRASGQLWYRTEGLSTDEVAWAVDVDDEGNIYWALEEKDQWPYWYYNILLFKIDPDARQVWQSDPWGNGTGFNDIAFKATVSAPYVYLSGRTDSAALPVSGDALVASFNISDGSFNWDYKYAPNPDFGYEEIDGLIVLPDGIYLSGWKQQQNANDMDFLVQKIDLSGDLAWSNTWDYESLGKFDGANGHMAMDDNFLYVAGHVNRTSITSLDGDGALVCFSRSNGEYQWHVTWGGELYDDALGMGMSSDSMLYVTGYTGSYGNGSQNYLNKYSRSGVLIWNRVWGGTGTEDSRALVADGDSIIYVIGATSSYGSGMKDIFVLKYDTDGTLIDSLFWGGTYDETAKDVAMFGDYLYITGETSSYGNGQINGDHKSDGLLLKINGRTMQGPDSTMTGINFPEFEEWAEFEIYPNPSDGISWVSCKNKFHDHDYHLKIFDITGRLIKQEEILDSHQQIDCSKLDNGIYLMQLSENNIAVGQKKIVKQ